jgi:cobalt-zinc-cadmium efflux system outer membrane protein
LKKNKPMKLTRLILAILLCSLLNRATAQSTLSDYIDIALKKNPTLSGYQFQSDALQQKIHPSKALEDPMLFGGIMNLPNNFSFNQDMMTMKQIGIQQNFSIAKKYSLKGKVAEKDYEASQYNIQSQKLFLIYKVKQQYYDLYSQTKALETTQNSIEALKNYIGIANSRYSTGQGTQQDIFKAQLELTKMQDELIKLQSMKEHMDATFNTLLARGLEDSVIISSEIKYFPVFLNMDSLMKEADENNPELLIAKTIIGKDSAANQLAKTSKIPDFNTSLWYGQRQALTPDGSKARDMLGFTFGLTLPVYSKNKQNPLISASNISIKQSQSQLEAIQNEIKLMVHHAIIDADKNQKLISLYEKQLIPQAEQTLNSGIIGYQENKIDFLTLTDNFLSLYSYRLQYQQAIADYHKTVAELEMLTGKNLVGQ